MNTKFWCQGCVRGLVRESQEFPVDKGGCDSRRPADKVLKKGWRSRLHIGYGTELGTHFTDMTQTLQKGLQDGIYRDRGKEDDPGKPGDES